MSILAEYMPGPNSTWEMMLDDAGLFGVARQAAEEALKRGQKYVWHTAGHPDLGLITNVIYPETPPAHTCEDDFQHFLSYSGLSNEPKAVIEKMRLAFAAAWEKTQ